MWLDKGQVDPSCSSLCPLDNRFDRTVPSLFTGLHCWLHSFYVYGMSVCSSLYIIDDGVNIRFEELLVVYISGVTERLVQFGMLTGMIVQSERGQDEFRDG